MSTEPRDAIHSPSRIVPIARPLGTFEPDSRVPRAPSRIGDLGVAPRNALQDAATTLLRYWKIIATSVIACVLAALLALALLVPVYEADALVQVDLSDKSYSKSISDEMAGMTGSKTPITAEIELLKSRLVLDPVIDRVGPELSVEPRRMPIVGAIAAKWPALAPSLRDAFASAGAYAWPGAALELRELEVPASLLGVPLMLELGADDTAYTLSDEGGVLVEGTLGKLSETRIGGAPLRIAVASATGGPGTTFVVVKRARNAVMRDLLKNYRASEQGRDSGLIRVAYRGADPEEVSTIVNLAVEQYQRQDIGWRGAKAARTLEFLRGQLPALSKKVDNAEAALTRHKLNKKSPDLGAETTLLLQQSVAAEQTLQQLRQQREDLQQRFTDSHPSMQALDAQIAQASEKRAELDRRIQTLPGSQRDLGELTRDLEVNTRLYVAMLDEVQQLEVAKSGTLGVVRIVDPAVTPLAPIFPRPGVFLAAALIVGLVGGAFVATLIRTMRNRIDTAADLSPVLGRRILASVRKSPAQLKATRQLGKAPECLPAILRQVPDDPAAKDIRRLCAALLTDATTADGGAIMITGLTPQAGRSFIAANLGIALVSAGQRTVVVDLDFEGRAMSRYFKSQDAGVLDWIGRRVNVIEAVVRNGDDGMPDLVSAGDASLQAAGVLPPQRMRSLFGELRRRYDYVIIHAPALSQFADGLVVGGAVDAVLLVARQADPLAPLTEATQRLGRAGANVAGIVVNQLQTSDRFGYIGRPVAC